MFCRNCGKKLIGTPQICANCGAQPVNATAFCRFCGGATTAQELLCPKCGCAIGVPAESRGASNKQGRGRRIRTRAILGILVVVTFVSAILVLALPPALRLLQSAASSVVQATTGYSSTPLDSITATPSGIPDVASAPKGLILGEMTTTAIFAINATQQLTINAIYKKPSTNNATGIGRTEDVTAKSIYRSSNEKIATVTSGGLVQGVAVGSANITVYYTAAPGSANLSAAAAGKIPITVSVVVPVFVGITFIVR